MSEANEEQKQAIDILLTWFQDKKPNTTTAILSGYAGSGKTFTTNHLIKALNLRAKDILVSAPTNKAVKVIVNMTGNKGKTIHSMLGLQPNMDLATFTPLTMKFVKKRDADMDYRLVIIDEASMINKALYKEIKERAEDTNIKVLFLGDSLQLLPVKENTVSQVFTDPIYKAELKNIVRQGEDNPNSEMIMVAIGDILNGRDTLDDYIENNFQTIFPSELKERKGFVLASKMRASTVDYFKADEQNLYLGESKYMAYTNVNVMGTTKQIRSKVFGINDYISKGEQLMGYRAVSLKKGKVMESIITNSEDYEVIECDKITIQDGIEGYTLTIRNYYTGQLNYVNVVDAEDKESFDRYEGILLGLYFNAKSLGRSAWVKYYDFVNNVLCFEDIETEVAGRPQKIKTKDIYYNSGITIHKSQGSTYKNSFVNLSNINRCRNSIDRRRLKYVALSRASNVNIII